MQRVVVVGGGLAGLAAALEAASSGHKVVVLEARNRLGGRATTTPGRYADLGHGPHVLLRGGTMHRLVRRLSRTRPATVALAPHRLHVIGHGPLRSLRSVRATASVRRTLRSSMPSDEPAVRAARLLAGWGLPAVEGSLGARAEALYMGQGLILRAGWADLIGRILAALDEVGVPI
ncbi:MAG: FAD-dependent oxidoreductase, partial [Candidatus Thermoplasmatota archaeon]|nr:FAD-dependent oxidoreductase [Candidatus Thermoplasmatota archaeon]